MWESICEWLSDNALAIFISAITSFIVSKYYFDKANRESVLMTIIFPIVKILDSRYYNRANYEALYKINSSYAAKYLKKDERNKLLALLTSYRNVCRYTKESADTDCIMSYYNHKLEENNINPKPCTITDDEGEFIDFDFPPDYNLLQDYVYEIVSSYDFVESPLDCSKKITEAFDRYTKKYYTNRKIVFFDDYSIDKIIEVSIVSQQWEAKFEMADKCKEEFLNLSICKKVTKLICESSVNEYDKKTKSKIDKNNDRRSKILEKIKKLKDTTYSSIYVVICFVEQTVILEALKDLTALIPNEATRNCVYFSGGLFSLILLLVVTSILIKSSKKIIENGEEGTYQKTDKVIECATVLGYLSPLLCLSTMYSGFDGLLLYKWGLIALVHILGIGMPLLIRKK